MFYNPLFVMSMAGSVVFLLYLLAYPLAKNYVSLKWRYRILKIAAAFYLLPVPIYKYFIVDMLRRFFPEEWKKFNHVSDIIYMKYAIFVGDNFVGFSPGLRHMLSGLLIVEIVSLVILQRRSVQYRKWKAVYSIGSGKPTGWEQELFQKAKEETGIKKDVRFLCSEYCCSPMAGGILFPVLIFPAWEGGMEKEQYEYMLKHELFHIRHRDLSMKYIGLLVMAVHWYNPLAYLLFHEISVISELYCDSAVISGKGEDGRRKYGELILTLAAKNPYVGKGKFFAGMADSRNKNVYKRRILEMKRNKKQKTAAAVMMTALICMAGGATAFAYHEPYIIEDLTGENAIGNETYFMPESEKEEPEKLLSDYFFMDNEGNVCDISGSDISVQRTCTHDFSIHGTFSEHEKDGKGGCTVKLYDAMQCSKCSKVKKGKLKNAITYQICPH